MEYFNLKIWKDRELNKKRDFKRKEKNQQCPMIKKPMISSVLYSNCFKSQKWKLKNFLQGIKSMKTINLINKLIKKDCVLKVTIITVEIISNLSKNCKSWISRKRVFWHRFLSLLTLLYSCSLYLTPSTTFLQISKLHVLIQQENLSVDYNRDYLINCFQHDIICCPNGEKSKAQDKKVWNNC